MKCPKCGAKHYFTCSESTKLEKTWKECFVCGFKEENEMNDLISREALFEKLEEHIEYADYDYYHEEPFINLSWEMVEDIVGTVPSVQQWIPCSERLPEEGESVQVTFIGYNDRLPHCDKFAYFHDKKWFWCYDHDEVIVKIVAWKPNCEPYKGE